MIQFKIITDDGPPVLVGGAKSGPARIVISHGKQTRSFYPRVDMRPPILTAEVFEQSNVKVYADHQIAPSVTVQIERVMVETVESVPLLIHPLLRSPYAKVCRGCGQDLSDGRKLDRTGPMRCLFCRNCLHKIMEASTRQRDSTDAEPLGHPLAGRCDGAATYKIQIDGQEPTFAGPEAGEFFIIIVTDAVCGPADRPLNDVVVAAVSFGRTGNDITKKSFLQEEIPAGSTINIHRLEADQELSEPVDVSRISRICFVCLAKSAQDVKLTTVPGSDSEICDACLVNLLTTSTSV